MLYYLVKVEMTCYNVVCRKSQGRSLPKSAQGILYGILRLISVHRAPLMPVKRYRRQPADPRGGWCYTDIQLKTLSRRIEVYNMKIIMRRDSIIFYFENNRIDNAIRRCLSNWNLRFQFEMSITSFGRGGPLPKTARSGVPRCGAPA